jgi:FAD/FMN-containing dehydrogenase
MTWTNWVGNQSFSPAAVVEPRDEDEVVRAVQQAARVRVAGAGHSFTPIVETDGMLLDLAAMRGVLSTDAARRGTTALPATLIRDFYEPLWEAGLALRNQGDIDTQQIAGAVATATHGSGIGNPSLSGFVRGVRLVTGACAGASCISSRPSACTSCTRAPATSCAPGGSSTPKACSSTTTCGRCSSEALRNFWASA